MRGGAVGSLMVVLVVAGAAPRARADEPEAAKKVKVAVFDVHAQGVDASTAQTITDVLAVELGKVPDLEVVTNAQVQSLLGLQAKKSMLGCDQDVSCMAEIAGSLGVEKLCIGSLGKLDEVSVLTLRVIDVASAQVDKSVYRRENQTSAFLDAMPDMVAQLFPEAKPPSMGQRAIADLKSLVTPRHDAPSAPVPAPKAVTEPAPPPSSGAMPWYRKPSVWAWVGGGLIVGGLFASRVDLNSGASLVGLGIVSGAASLTLCVCPWNKGAGDDEPAVRVVAPKAPSAPSGAVRNE